MDIESDLVAEYVCRLLIHMDQRGCQICMPVEPDTPQREPIIDLQSGYVLRSVAMLPKQGTCAPWRLHQNYPRDVLLMRHGSLEDAGMRFTRAPVALRAAHASLAGPTSIGT